MHFGADIEAYFLYLYSHFSTDDVSSFVDLYNCFSAFILS